jgi:hypothetical protein
MPHHVRTIHKTTRNLLLISLLSSACMTGTARADATNDELLQQMKAMQAQITALQSQLKEVQKKAVAANSTASKAEAKAIKADATAVKAASLQPAAGTATVAAAKPDAGGTTLINKNNIKLTLGGFVEAAAINRTRNETADMGSSFSGIPFPNSPSYHLSEFRGSARQSRLSLLAQGSVDPDTNLGAYYEADFLGAATTANSTESNSYTPRLRQVYATLDRNDLGLHVLSGQAWSLLTLNKKGITERQENVPLTIDAQYVPGFTWTRNPQARVVKDFLDKKLWAGISLESPQSIIFNGPNTAAGAPTFNNPGGSQFASTSNYSTDIAPDVIGKIAVDPGYGHYEVFGIGRFFRDRNHFSNDTIMGGGAGVGAILPIISKRLDFQISGLAGKGVGRYGSAQLPDITIKPDGSIATVGEVIALAGLVGHPTDDWDAYLYAGTERAQKQAYNSGGLGFGYGNSLYNNSGCRTEGAAASTCVANTAAVSQITAGAWWKFYHGSYGAMQVGLQDSFTRRETFSGVGGAPSTNDNITMVSFRYYPF